MKIRLIVIAATVNLPSESLLTIGGSNKAGLQVWMLKDDTWACIACLLAVDNELTVYSLSSSNLVTFRTISDSCRLQYLRFSWNFAQQRRTDTENKFRLRWKRYYCGYYCGPKYSLSISNNFSCSCKLLQFKIKVYGTNRVFQDKLSCITFFWDRYGFIEREEEVLNDYFSSNLHRLLSI